MENARNGAYAEFEPPAIAATTGRIGRLKAVSGGNEKATEWQLNMEDGMPLILLVLLIALLFAGLGFAVHLLWIIAVVLFVFWLIGWAVSSGASAGSRRTWFGRW